MQHLAAKFNDSRNLFIKIKNKGQYEQETDYLFPTLYKEGRTVTRAEKGAWQHLNNVLKTNKLKPIKTN